ncbi:MAG: methyltransferase domain-containing protein [Rhodobacteraceae bacterium]|nr:methyltransferase domain-containing protein [Paracoccaceae bacterium]
MVDFTALPPAAQARQLGLPEGEVGIDIGLRMNRTNRAGNVAAVDRLELAPGHAVLEIGPGNGRLLPDLMARAAGLRYLGIDISPTMVAEARAFNAARIAMGEAAFELAEATAIPAADASFDRALAVNVIYFWPDPVVQLREIRRVLAPGGRLVVASTTPETARAMPAMRAEFGLVTRTAEELTALHREADFTEVSVDVMRDTVPRPDGTPWEVTAFLVVARV